MGKYGKYVAKDVAECANSKERVNCKRPSVSSQTWQRRHVLTYTGTNKNIGHKNMRIFIFVK